MPIKRGIPASSSSITKATSSKRIKTTSASQKAPKATSSSMSAQAIASRKQWEEDFAMCERQWGKSGDVEGYVGLHASIRNIGTSTQTDTFTCTVNLEDIDGKIYTFTLKVVSMGLEHYPTCYTTTCDVIRGQTPARAARAFKRFANAYYLSISAFLTHLIWALQGDDDRSGDNSVINCSSEAEENSNAVSEAEEPEDMEFEDDDYMPDLDDHPAIAVGRGFEVAKGSTLDLGKSWKDLKEHFEQAKSMGYRPGFTQVSDFWVVSFSIPLKSLPIGPDTLAIWDDSLVEAWKADRRFTLLVKVTEYPPHPDRMEHYLLLEEHYKPSVETITRAVRGQGFLKTFPLAYKIRTGFHLDWDSADRNAFDPVLSEDIFHRHADALGTTDFHGDDPIVRQFASNIPLCAFYWVVRRFVEATRFCTSCGLEVKIPSLRPYVCDKPLCLYSFMSLGLGPSVEHTIVSQPAVVDLLLSFAYSALNSTARIDLPLQLHIEIPIAFGLESPTLVDKLDEAKMRPALVFLIEQLPKVSEIKAHLEGGAKLNSLDCPSGSVGVLRWVIGSCQAYLKEAKPGEGMANMGNFRQFTFVVGSPEQEQNFKMEKELAKEADPARCGSYPTLLAFHGSALSRWHNILRRGLDFQETTNGRAYGHGVYFASEYETSVGYTTRHVAIQTRINADSAFCSAVALVELINRPDTFVSQNPFYVVNNVKQIKPFLLLVSVTNGDMENAADVDGDLFQHDPKLVRATTAKGAVVQVKMPRKVLQEAFVDSEADDEGDRKLFAPKASRCKFEASPQSRFDRLEVFPPPSDISITATRALGKELKALLSTQEEGGLPFYLNPEDDRLYCWTLELHDFPDSLLMTDMQKHKIKSIITEIRFPASFPHAPPFLRILHPRFLPFSQGGGGNITAGGSICNEILTSSGWNPAFCVEAIVRDIMTNMTEATPPARLDHHWDRAYTIHEAMEAYKRVATVHGWEVPKDFAKMAL